MLLRVKSRGALLGCVFSVCQDVSFPIFFFLDLQPMNDLFNLIREKKIKKKIISAQQIVYITKVDNS